MDSSPNLVSERSSGFIPQHSSGTFEEPRTTRADSKRARTGNSSSNEEVNAQSVHKGSFFPLPLMAARHNILSDANHPSGRLRVILKVWGKIFLWARSTSQGEGCIWRPLNFNLLFTMILHWEIIFHDYRWKLICHYFRHRRWLKIRLHLRARVPERLTQSLLWRVRR